MDRKKKTGIAGHQNVRGKGLGRNLVVKSQKGHRYSHLPEGKVACDFHKDRVVKKIKGNKEFHTKW